MSLVYYLNDKVLQVLNQKKYDENDANAFQRHQPPRLLVKEINKRNGTVKKQNRQFYVGRIELRPNEFEQRNAHGVQKEKRYVVQHQYAQFGVIVTRLVKKQVYDKRIKRQQYDLHEHHVFVKKAHLRRIAGTVILQQCLVNPIPAHTGDGGANKEHGKRLLVPASLPFYIGPLHTARRYDKLFERIAKALFEVCEKMENIVQKAPQRNAFYFIRLAAAAAIIAFAPIAAGFTNLNSVGAHHAVVY